MKIKTCFKCKQNKILSDFDNFNAQKIKGTCYCKKCRKIERQLHKQQRHNYQINYYNTHKIETAKKQKIYYVNHKNEINQKHQIWLNQNKAQRKLYNHKYAKSYYEKNKIQINQKVSQYRKNNLHKINSYILTPNGIYNVIKNGAKQRKINFLITKKMFTHWYLKQEQKCHYCNRPHNQTINDNWGHNRRLSIDRKNNAVGYVINNLVLACFRCNAIKSDYFTEKEMLKIGKIISFKENREELK